MGVRSIAFALVLGSFSVAACAISGPHPGDDGADGVMPDVEIAADQIGWTCVGLIGKALPPSNHYYTTTFGCWSDGNGKIHYDSGDNCVPACTYKPGWTELCGKRNGPACLSYVNWYSADADRFGCFARILVENPKNGRRAVLAVVDRGPNCYVEKKVAHAVLDMSHPASEYLFGGPTGWSDKADAIVTPVPASTPLGPYKGGSSSAASTSASSATASSSSASTTASSSTSSGSGGGGPGPNGPIVIDSNNAYNTGSAHFAASSNWAASSSVSGYWDDGYSWRAVGSTSDAASFSFHLASAHKVLVEAWWPASSNRSTQAPFLVYDGNDKQVGKVYVNQRDQGGTWIGIGSYYLAAGDAHVDLSRWTAGSGVVVADAVRVTPLD